MAFIPIDSNKLKVGDPITKNILDLIKSNFDDLDTRVNNLQTTGGSVHILNGDFSFVNFSMTSPVIFYYTARQDFSINDFRVKLLGKGGVASGTVSFDLQKSDGTGNLNDGNFSSILTGNLSFNLSTAGEFDLGVSTLNTSQNNIVTGRVLRIKIMSYPVNFKQSVLISIGGE